MVASTFGGAFDKLEHRVQRQIVTLLQERKRSYRNAEKRIYCGDVRVVLIADTPGPGRPTIPGYHHTPFYSTKNSSLWLNRQLAEAGIDEKHLLWFNSTLADGSSLDPVYLKDLETMDPVIVALGGNAEKWLLKVADRTDYLKVHHPQAWKRFHSSEEYPLIPILKAACST